MTLDGVGSARRPAATWVLPAVFVALVVVLLIWAKWQPYWIKVPQVAGTGDAGKSIVTGGTAAPPAVSVQAGLGFAGTYFLAIWPALVAALVIGAAVQVLLPQNWLTTLFGRDDPTGAVRGAALAVPSMMCTCCAAPIAVGLRRRTAGVGSTLAYWLGNPALNPVVLAFCVFVLPWPWTVLRAGAGLAVVVASVGAARLVGARGRTADPPAEPDPEPAPAAPAAAARTDTRPTPVAFLRALGGLAVRLVPEYGLLVVVLGAFRGVLFPLGTTVAVGVLGVVVLAVAGTLLPIPTGGEVAVIAAMLAVGISGPVAAALLITLPAVSLPSLVMVRRAFGARLLAAVGGTVVVVGVLTAAIAALVGL